jgi:hypothetical protein
MKKNNTNTWLLAVIGGGTIAYLWWQGKEKKSLPTTTGGLEVDPNRPATVYPVPTVTVPAVDQPGIDIVRDLLKGAPTPGHLYQIRQGDNLSALTTRAYGAKSGAYARAIASCRWNVALYGNEATPLQTTGMGLWDGRRISIGSAFLPYNASVVPTLAAGLPLERVVQWERTSQQSSQPGKTRWKEKPSFPGYGMLWLPPLGSDGKPLVWAYDAPEGMPPGLAQSLGLDPPKPWEQ